MKSSLFQSLLILFIFLYGCNQKEASKDITIADFSKPQTFTLKPSDNKL